MNKEEADYLSWQPRIFEISRRGAYDLSPPWYPGRATKTVFADVTKMKTSWFRDWLFAPGVIWKLIDHRAAMLVMAAWISVTIARRTLPGGGTAVQRLKRALVSTTFWLVCGGPLIVFSIAMLAI